MESKYRWRETKRKCPVCGEESIIKGKAEYGGGWLCFKKIGGCGTKWDNDAAEMIEQKVGQVENEDIYSQVNTILKMAKKRALVDAALSAGRLSQVFTQDIEDMGNLNVEVAETEQPKAKTKKPKPEVLEGEVVEQLSNPPVPSETKEQLPERQALIKDIISGIASLQAKELKGWTEAPLLARMLKDYHIVEAKSVLEAINQMPDNALKHLLNKVKETLEMA